ncbi:hypothetical protein ACTXOR_16225 [Arthrobacter rhombi]|uniref:hypothetical protein n=1 Tax=Arthrobacter rhombi TaxID=71253 RepID=UPI003FD598E3
MLAQLRMFWMTVSAQVGAVVHDAVHDRICGHRGADRLRLFLLGILRSEQRRGGVASVSQQVLQLAAHARIGVLVKPFIDHRQSEGSKISFGTCGLSFFSCPVEVPKG